jgi:hypothetical protein
VPRSLIDGTLWRLAHRLYEKNPQGPHPRLDLEVRERRIRERHAAARGPEAITQALTGTAHEVEQWLTEAVEGQERAAA